MSGTSRRITTQRLCSGRTFSPALSTCTFGESATTNTSSVSTNGRAVFSKHETEETLSAVRVLPLSAWITRFLSVVRFLTSRKLATVEMGTYWSASICDRRYWSLARFSLQHTSTALRQGDRSTTNKGCETRIKSSGQRNTNLSSKQLADASST